MADSLRGGGTVGGYPIVTKSQIPFSFRESGGKLQYALDGVNFVDVEFTGDATAGAGDMLSGKTAYVNGSKATGTIPIRYLTSMTPSTSNQIVEWGYYGGNVNVIGDPDLISANIKSGKNIFGVAGSSNVVDTSAGDATHWDIKNGKKSYVDGKLVTGTMPSFSGFYDADYISKSGNTLQISPPTEGYYVDSSYIQYTDNDWIESNIKSGVNMFGKVGTMAEGLSIKRVQKGTYNIYSYVEASITIEAVDLSCAVAFCDSGVAPVKSGASKVHLANETRLTFVRGTGYSGVDYYVNWTVIEFNNAKSVQSGSMGISTPYNTSRNDFDVTINTVNPDNCLVFFSFMSYYGSSDSSAGQYGGYARVTSSTKLRLTAMNSYDSTMYIQWYVVELL